MRRDGYAQFVGQSAPVLALRAEIARVAESDAKVLITGESGVGKELVAVSIHAQSLRAGRAFVAVNSAGLTETLLESELFGHVRGSFTGAHRDRQGKLEMAHEGTVFLDEIGEMSPRMQGLMLRFLETGEIQKVGADRLGARVDVRVIAATNRDLGDMVAQSQFREDLYYRMNVIHLRVPPLRERRDDIPLLVEHFLSNMAHSSEHPLTLRSETYATLAKYHWPGNVRELQNVIERLLVSCSGPDVRPEDLPAEVRAPRSISARDGRPRPRTVVDDLYKRMVDNHESFWSVVYPLYMEREITRATLRELVAKALEETRGNYKTVTRLFNMDPAEYKRFLSFLRKHECHLPFKEYRWRPVA